ncbi:DMSO/selenate family reductase complex A subunit [Corynebacterium guangdongense]|uniref:Anaerobic dimethyl sulfoxide reductase subunit A n=1 Tax=Corynebacterium guangdongense TaxID=1783348 RepID=A0ABU1ZZM7_9CORY|nr:DMSO/selenate family reductase complex A subunit [Corynebacterium guangdongense]MDR7329848.1 anaerobic dimethyl sulfoxide reductase subunit A [Corynebacterium guangdongense]WJZ18411.1 Dimethyl sulfoxide reductase DmsA precursor [Corynebacterium guangdongense]
MGNAVNGVSRRSFLAWTGAVGATTALVSATQFGATPGVGKHNAAFAQESDNAPEGQKIVWSACTVNCGSRCPLRLVVEDGRVTRVLPDNTGTDEVGSQQIRACVRGRSIRHRIYNPDRLKTPLKRVAGTERGAGQWEEISWEQALDEIADKMKQLLADYGNESIYLQYGTGTIGATIARSWPPIQTPFARLMNLIGGYLNHYGDYSSAQIAGAYPYFYGEWTPSNSFDDVKNAKLQVMFGNNPLETRMSGGGETMVTQKIKQDHGVKTIVIDPRYSETAVGLGDEWVALRPGTDAALVAGIAHVLIEENLHDQEFLDTYCVGFDEKTLPKEAAPNSDYRSYIEGRGPDRTAKTPEWAAGVTGVPATRIRQLAREMGGAKPVAITQGWGPQRHANGENQARAVFTLACLLGQPGIPGGGTGGREASASLPMASPFNTQYENPVETAISVATWTDAVDRGAEMTATRDGVRGRDRLDVPIKMIWQYGGNALTNQHGDINRTMNLLRDEDKAELIVVSDIQMTTSARMADYVLPDASTAEQEDVIAQGSSGNMEYTILASQALTPLYNCRPIYDVLADLAERFGVREKFTEGRTQQEWVQHTLDESRKEIGELPDYGELKEMGIWRREGESVIPLKEFREDPAANPLPTPSGKIEIYSQALADLAEEWEFDANIPGDRITALPEHVDTWEGAMEARTSDKYPLQCIGHHFKGRTHSTYGNVDWLCDDAHPQILWINTLDAHARGIENEDAVYAYNDRGRVRSIARVTPRIAPGVISIPQGSWFDLNKEGVDVGSSVNTLTSWRPSPIAKGNAQHTTIVQVEKA